MNKGQFKYIIPQRLQFPTKLVFRSETNGFLKCNEKLVQVVPSLQIKKSDNPPTDISIYGIGKYTFILSEADIVILSFVNSTSKKTDCCIIEKQELVGRLKPYNYTGEKVNLNLVLSKKGLHEYSNVGAEGWFMALWLDELRNFSRFHNNWSILNHDTY